MPAKPFSDEELKDLNVYEEIDEFSSGMTNAEIEEGRRFLDTIAADRQRFEETIKGYTNDWANQKRKFEKRIAELEKIVKDQPDPMDYDALVFVNHTLEAESQRLRDLLLEAIKWVDKYDWNQARGLEYKLKQALRPRGEAPCEK